MRIARDGAELRGAIGGYRARGETVALVPTMGALHAGHLSLVAVARAQARRVVASIFVNPRQFGAGEDLARYPRPEARDRAMLEAAGTDLLFLPSAETIYPAGFATTVSVAGLDGRYEGAARPGHFDGVATVVTRLLMLAQPDMAVFGEKDWQQLAIVRRLVADLALPVRIVGAPIVRDADGLALSSRNAYLTADERARAAHFPRILAETAAAIEAGTAVPDAIARAREELAAAGLPADYLALADADTLEPLNRPLSPARLLAAVRAGTTRLLDNLPIGPAHGA
jgi:pantoate--beta-alanine ligase